MSDDLVKRLRRDAQAARDYLGPPEIAPSISLDDAEDAADRIEAQAAEIKDITDKLLDPNAVHINMLRGRIAKPTLNQIEHLYPEIRELRAEIDRLKRPMDDEEMVAIAKQAATDHLPDKAKKWDAAVAISRALGAITPHIRAREAFRAGAEAMREAAVQICEDQIAKFLDPQYAFPQPVGSIQERFACGECANAIRALPIGDAT